MAAGESAASAAATEHSDTTPLLQLLNQESGQARAYELKVVRAEVVAYTFPFQGKQIATQKVQALLKSHNPIEYCLGIAVLQKEDKEELQQVFKRFVVDITWQFTALKLLHDTSASIHTTCPITIDLRKTTATAMLQSTPFPRTPRPMITIADILELKPMQQSSASHVHATEQDLSIQHNQHEAELTATTAEKGLVQFSTIRDMQPLDILHAHEDTPDTLTTYRLLLYHNIEHERSASNLDTPVHDPVVSL